MMAIDLRIHILHRHPDIQTAEDRRADRARDIPDDQVEDIRWVDQLAACSRLLVDIPVEWQDTRAERTDRLTVTVVLERCHLQSQQTVVSF